MAPIQIRKYARGDDEGVRRLVRLAGQALKIPVPQPDGMHHTFVAASRGDAGETHVHGFASVQREFRTENAREGNAGPAAPKPTVLVRYRLDFFVDPHSRDLGSLSEELVQMAVNSASRDPKISEVWATTPAGPEPQHERARKILEGLEPDWTREIRNRVHYRFRTR